MADAGVDAGVNPTNVCLDVAKKKCDFYIRCRTDQVDSQGRNNDQVAAGERSKCEALYANERGCNVGAAGWANGRANLNAVKYAACIDALYPAASCTRDLNDAQNKCGNNAFFTPATVAGGTCTSDGECINGWCQISTGSICGTCQAWLNADGGMTSCVRDAQCDPTRSFCFGGDTSPQNQPCRAYTAVDAGCTFFSVNQEECGPGNVCAATSPGFNNNPKCLPAKLENATCIKGRAECFRAGRSRVDLTCATDSQGFETCQKQFNTTAGGRCLTGETFGGGTPPSGTFCLETEFCSSGICANRRPAGQVCNSVDQCQAGLRCSGGTCTAFLDVDAGCTSSDACKNQLNCNTGTSTCQPGLAVVGGACSGGNNGIACAEGFCGQAAVTVCTALLADGQVCNNFAQCQSYSCVAGTCAKACWKP